MMRFSCFFTASIAVAMSSVACFAQGPAQRRANLLSGNGDDTRQQLKDVEGFIWEFKVMENTERDRSQKTKMTGRIRIKQTSLFGSGEVKVQASAAGNSPRNAEDLMKEFDLNSDRVLSLTELNRLLVSVRNEPRTDPKTGATSTPSSLQADLKGLLSRRVNRSQDEATGGERIGDLTKSASSEKRLRFDEDDSHPLSGIVVVRPDTANRNGVWFGYYDEFAGGKKQKRWRFEMRKVEE